MALLTEQRLRARAQREFQRSYKPAPQRLNEAVAAASRTDHFDVFLSHSIKDAELVDGARLELEDKGLVVYVDWIVDAQLSRESVTPDTARVLRTRMLQSESLLYMHTENSPSSKWMPWELGFFDGRKGAVAILPVVKRPASTFAGQEYLGIYPYVDADMAVGSGREELRVNKSIYEYSSFQSWKSDPGKLRR